MYSFDNDDFNNKKYIYVLYNIIKSSFLKPIKTDCLCFWLVKDHDRDTVGFGIAKGSDEKIKS